MITLPTEVPPQEPIKCWSPTNIDPMNKTDSTEVQKLKHRG